MAGDAVTDLCETHAHLPREAAIYMVRRAPAWVHHTDLEPAAWHGLYLAAATFDPDRVSVSFNGVKVFDTGALGEDRSLVDLTNREVLVEIDLAAGPASATVWTNDLTYDYVRENAEYSS